MLDDPLQPGGKPTWWLERVIVWTEVPTMEPWRLDGYPSDTDDRAVLQFWYDCLRTFLQLRGEVQQAELADPDIHKRRAERNKMRDVYAEFDPDNPEDQDPDGDWTDEWDAMLGDTERDPFDFST